MNITRPSRIILAASDPFDGQLLGVFDLPYERRKSAAGFYSARVRMLRELHKQIDSKILQGRTPRISFTYR